MCTRMGKLLEIALSQATAVQHYIRNNKNVTYLKNKKNVRSTYILSAILPFFATEKYTYILIPFQIVSCSIIFRYIISVTYLDIYYI
jgi:hypothetical protein